MAETEAEAPAPPSIHEKWEDTIQKAPAGNDQDPHEDDQDPHDQAPILGEALEYG